MPRGKPGDRRKTKGGDENESCYPWRASTKELLSKGSNTTHSILLVRSRSLRAKSTCGRIGDRLRRTCPRASESNFQVQSNVLAFVYHP
ncbi:hypothetical protein TNCT_706751 [Trichonephila clavata]|uniref:Uncharacterized protein n=1 Tax=Trichonephila clavata TaxID=2740835 RepID=A0A8X6HYU4_TRICU|nr:hypothetical protein TNCT_706751 [Trichonephila clavata]